MERLHYLDVTRGFAIVLMIIYHFSFDLDNFNYINIDMNHDPFWTTFRSIIVTLFLTTMGISLALTHSKEDRGICWPCIKKRTLYLGAASLLVSVGSYLQFPDSWIYFGILHFILFASWLGLLFVGKPWLSLITAILILVGSNYGWLHTHALFEITYKPLHLPVKYTEDMVNVFPWFAPVLIGIFIVAKDWHQIPHLNPSSLSRKLAFMGQHSLIIYLIHQPILFGAILLFKNLLNTTP